METIHSQIPDLLGYAVVVTALLAGVAVGILFDPAVRARRIHNRVHRHAKAGCRVCILRLRLTAKEEGTR